MDRLAAERAASGVTSEAAELAFHGNRTTTDKIRRLTALWYDDPLVRSLRKAEACFLPRHAVFSRGVRLARRLAELRVARGLGPDDFEVLKQVAYEHTPLTIHDTVFVPALELLASTEQQGGAEGTLARARAWAITGAYAQTELGHGSDVRGIETTATYRPDTDDFELSSPPGASSTKWWVGALGVSATHAVIAAQLVVEGARRGVRMFLARIRDESGRPRAGVAAVGDIGPKLGFASVDNGFMRLKGLVVPAEAMLTASARVRRERSGDGQWRGVYEPVDRSAAEGAQAASAYASLVEARFFVTRLAHLTLARGATIAIRYAAVRTQFARPGAAQETPLLDYPSHQGRLMPPLALAYACKMLSDAIPGLAAQAAARGGAKALHVLSGGLKVAVTEAVAGALEELRRACGGQGYSMASGLPQLCTMFVHLVTAEGDNTVLCQQVGRALAAAAAALSDGDVRALLPFNEPPAAAPPVASISDLPICGPPCWSCVQSLLCVALQHTLHGIRVAETAPETAVPLMMSATSLYGSHVMLGAFADACAAKRVGDASAGLLASALPALDSLCDVFALSVLQRHALLPVLDAGVLAPAGASSGVDAALAAACFRARRYAIPLTDAFLLHDDALGSVIGAAAADGGTWDARLLAWAAQEPANTMPDAGVARDLQLLRRVGADALDRQAALCAAGRGGASAKL